MRIYRETATRDRDLEIRLQSPKLVVQLKFMGDKAKIPATNWLTHTQLIT